MNVEHHVKEIFSQALEYKSAAEREMFLGKTCRDQPELRSQVESLLRAHEKAGDFLSQTIQLPPADFEPEPIGSVIGRYKLLEKIGEGGFGVVYMAEQQEPVQRKVALKIIKAGMDTREVVARFEAERQALALMDHPNIAKVLDGGTTEARRPYFVMELVRGIPITDYCDQNNLSTTQRLQLFIKVCQAVQHAHQKAVIHRDLKPSNILVTLHDGEPFPKVIDFGVAKALGQKLTEKTLFTAFRQMIGTPAYMSPEQAEMGGLDIDTRSDIYSLGVLLYELLTGVTPFDKEKFARAALDEIRRMIRETEPPKPSTRLRTLGDKLTEVARHRRTEPAALSRLVHGDLDWIVMKCLEKDRTRRYETANGLATDIQRHLNNEPVTAAAPGATYRARKFIRRHKAGLATGAALILFIAGSAVVSTLEAVRATRAERTQTQLRTQSHQRLVRLNTANGARLLEEGDYLGSLAWFAEAFKLDSSASGQDSIHRLRLGMLLQQCPRPVQTWFHSDQVNSATFSPDGRWALTASRDRRARVWDVETGEAVGPAMVHIGEVAQACFSPDSKLALSCGSEDGVLVWRPISGEVVRRLECPGSFYAVFSPDGRLVAAASGDQVRVWETATGRELLSPIVGRVSCLAFSHDSGRLVAGIGGRTGQLWDLASKKKLLDLDVVQWLRFLAFSPDDSLVAAADEANGAFVWEVASGKRTAILRHDAAATHVEFSADGRWLASSSSDGTTKIWEPRSGVLLSAMAHPGFPMEAVFSGDCNRLLTRTFDGWLHLWNPKTGKGALPPIRHASWVTAAQFHPDGRRVMTSCADGSVRIWDLQPDGALFWPWPGKACRIIGASHDGARVITQDSRFEVQVWATDTWLCETHCPSATDRLLAAFLSHDSKRLLMVEPVTTTDNTRFWELRVIVWSCETGSVLADLKIQTPSVGLPLVFDVDRDCSRMALGQRTDIQIWDVLGAKLLSQQPLRRPSLVNILRFSSDGRRLIVGCGEVHALDSTNGAEVLPRLTNMVWTSAVEFSPDGSLIGAAGSDVTYGFGQARIWDAATGRLLHRMTFTDGERPVGAVALSPDSRWLASGCEDRTARVRDIQTGAPVTPKLLHSGAVVSLAFSPDSRLLASVSDDGALRVWHILTGEPLTPPLGRGCGASHVRFLAGSRYLLTNARAGRQLWRLETATLPVEDLAGLAQIFASHRVDPTGALEPLPRSVQTNLHATLHKRFPGYFAPNHSPPDSEPTQTHVEVVSRGVDAGSQQIDLTPYYNARLDESWQSGARGHDLASLPTGVQLLDGVAFDIRGIVQLTRGDGFTLQWRSFPVRVSGIQMHVKCRYLHFLHAADSSVRTGVEVGHYLVRYRNHQQRTLSLFYGEDLRDWQVASAPEGPPQRATVAWQGVNASGDAVCLCHSVWENLTPDIEIDRIDFVSAMSGCAPFLVAITAEP